MTHGMIPPERFLPYLTWRQIEAMPDKGRVVVIQPLGAVEQHGAHLPLVTDLAITTGVLGAALARLDPAFPAYCLAPLSYGKSDEHSDFPGTITLTAETLLRVLAEIGESVYRAGFRKLVFANGHGGQPQIVEVAARQLRVTHRDLQVFPLFIWNVPHVASRLLQPIELESGLHAGDAETSLMLALLPQHVRMQHACREYPPASARGGLVSAEGKLTFAWVTSDLSASGVIGDPTDASAEKGAALLDSLSEGWARLLTEVHEFRQPRTAQ